MIDVWLLAFYIGASEQNVRKLVGQTATVCGRVATYGHPAEKKRSCDARFDLDTPSWRPQFYFLFPEDLRTALPDPPEATYLGQDVCVTGLIAADEKRIPYVVVKDVRQIKFKGTPLPVSSFGRGVRFSCDKRITEPELVRDVPPSYPDAQLRIGVEDTLALEAIVDVDGSVSDVRTIYLRYREFEQEAHKAIRQWRFTPATQDGNRVPAIVAIELKFTLR